VTQTPPTTTYKRGDVVLVPFPFTDLMGVKRRPGLVVSTEAHNTATRDIVIAQITGNVTGNPRVGDHNIAGWQQAGLVAPSIVRAKLATIETTQINRTIGRLLPADMTQVNAKLRTMLAL